MTPPADHGERSYVGSSRLTGKVAINTGGDSGIGRAVAIAYAREGSDIVPSYLKTEQKDAEVTRGGSNRLAEELFFSREIFRSLDIAGLQRRCVSVTQACFSAVTAFWTSEARVPTGLSRALLAIEKGDSPLLYIR